MICLWGVHIEREGEGAIARLYLPPAGVIPFLHGLGVGEAMLLQTCNRWELVVPDSPRAMARVGSWCEERGGFPGRIYRGREAFFHLCRVVAGMDSVVPGDTEIVSQFKAAWRQVAEAGTVGPVLLNLCQQVLGVAKRIRSCCTLSQGYRSVAGLAAWWMREQLGPGGRIAVLGTGRVARDVLRYGVQMGLTAAMVAGRRYEAACALAEECGGEAVLLEDLPLVLERADAVVGASAAPHLLLRREDHAPLIAARERPLLLVDLAVPHDIDPGLAELPQVTYVDVVDLGRRRQEVWERRRDALVRAEEILEEEGSARYARLEAWYQRKQARPRPGEGVDRAVERRLA
ncbi:glutamyl-tRNA reductase [Spirochaeta thermophila]|uniref:Glutamyl-tRNA reductase n=1 Tax=Winmispira thermophila (strain ATCC 49972 / DSM 6192 / RI 19.B1) TaxID=665571 RepID=E0RN86_WINT6|nr:glutamyl-tRNA reductase [Spirochaeta thermophila]ADN02555.1 glutamyl-tRNA reductase [Spirochaeta thermophila DSM 6192]